MLDGRYEVFAAKGKGVFSTVLRARDTRAALQPATGQLLVLQRGAALQEGWVHPEVAIKVWRHGRDFPCTISLRISGTSFLALQRLQQLQFCASVA